MIVILSLGIFTFICILVGYFNQKNLGKRYDIHRLEQQRRKMIAHDDKVHGKFHNRRNN